MQHDGHSTSGERNPGQERFSPLAVCSGAITGAVISNLLKPLADHLPGTLFEEFFNGAVEHVFSWGIPALFGIAALRIRRFDLVLRKYLIGAAPVLSLLITASLWLHAGTPAGKGPWICLSATAIEAWLYLLFCGGAIQFGLHQFTGSQTAEYEKDRKTEAGKIAMGAVAEGDPQLAAGLFGLNAAGGIGKILLLSLKLLLLAFLLLFLLVISAFDAQILFKFSLFWSWFAGVIIFAAAISLLIGSLNLGQRYSGQVPLSAKSSPILPTPDDNTEAD